MAYIEHTVYLAILYESSLAAATCCKFSVSTRIRAWKLPSPTCPIMGAEGEGRSYNKIYLSNCQTRFSSCCSDLCSCINTRTTVQNWRASCHNYMTPDCLISRTDQPQITLVWPQCTTLTVCLLWSVDMYVPVKGEASKSFFVSSSTCGSLEIGTHTSVVIPWEHTTRNRLIDFESSCGRTYSAQVGQV